MSKMLIELERVTQVFSAGAGASNMKALDDVSLDIAEREFVALVGPSGCGKSTILNLVAGLIEPSQGDVRYRGKTVTGVNVNVGYMTQKDTLLPWRTTEGNIGLPLELRARRNDVEQDPAIVQQYIDLVGLRGFEKHYPRQLSGGMRKRALLARTLIYRPATLLMDEPFGALDAQLKLVMQSELLRIWTEIQNTILFVTHDLGEAIALADRVVIFTARPASVKAIEVIDIPRPRDVSRIRFTPHYGELYEKLWSLLQSEVGEGTDV